MSRICCERDSSAMGHAKEILAVCASVIEKDIVLTSGWIVGHGVKMGNL